jgi:hypothetical protein
LFEPELEYLSATEVDKNNEGYTDWDPYLKSKRHALLERRFDKMRETQKRQRPIHYLTLSISTAVQDKNWAYAESLFLDCLQKMEAGTTVSSTQDSQCYHIVFVLDESGSMVFLISTILCQQHSMSQYVITFTFNLLIFTPNVFANTWGTKVLFLK